MIIKNLITEITKKINEHTAEKKLKLQKYLIGFAKAAKRKWDKINFGTFDDDFLFLLVFDESFLSFHSKVAGISPNL